MRVIITQNRNKAGGVVNGQAAIVKYRQGNSYILMLPNGSHVSAHPVTHFPSNSVSLPVEARKLNTCYPFVPGYSLTIFKCVGHTLRSAVVWYDCSKLPEGSGYVALSRVKTPRDIKFVTPLKATNFKPVALGHNR